LEALLDEAEVAAWEAADPLVLTIDVGSSSVRVAIVDGAGRAVRDMVARRQYALRTTAEGAAEANADVLLRYVEACIDEMLASLERSKLVVRAVACDTFWHSLVGVRKDLSPATTVLTWADTRSVNASAQLRRNLDAEAVHQRTGAGLYANFLPAKLVWLCETQRDAFAASSHWMSLGEYLYLKFFGRLRVSISMASGTGLFDQRRCTWDDELIRALPVQVDQLSPITEFSAAFNGLIDGYAKRWPALADIPWYLPLGDGACNNIGSGGVDEERAVLMVGTSGAIRVVRRSENFHVPKGLWAYRVDAKRIVQGGSLSSGGNVFAWLAHSLSSTDPEQLEAGLSEVAPDSHGLTALPFLAGERSPGWHADARAAIVGMTLATTPAEIARAMLEGVAFRFGLVFSILTAEIGKVRGIIGSGVGLLHSPAWMEIMTDVLGRPITVSAVEEATCRGAALLALEAMGHVRDLAALPAPVGKTFQPKGENTRIYAAATKRQEDLYERLLA
jgi:gluconokinase